MADLPAWNIPDIDKLMRQGFYRVKEATDKSANIALSLHGRDITKTKYTRPGKE